MKKTAKSILMLILVLCCVFMLTACDEKDFIGVYRQAYHLTVAEIEIKANGTVTYSVWEIVNGDELVNGTVTEGYYDEESNILTVIVLDVPLEAYLSEDKQTLTMYNPAYSDEIPVGIFKRVNE